MKTDLTLLELPQDQADQLAAWLLEGIPFTKALPMLEKEFGILATMEQIAVFWDVACIPTLIQSRSKAASTAEEIAKTAEQTPDRFSQATLALLKQRTFELLLTPKLDVNDFKSLFALVLKNEEQTMQARRLELQDKKNTHSDTEESLTEPEREARMKEIFGVTE
jgi:hypothetical protein